MPPKKKPFLTAAFISALLTSAVAGLQSVNLANANPGVPTSPILAMPEETVNYTITSINGTLWAKIDGTYPIHKIFKTGDTFTLDNTSYCIATDDLPMVYPTPPGTINIHVKLNETELNWSNFTENYPDALHHTAIGNWPMIYSDITPAPEYFTLKIHYEHPLAKVNGSYLFLYDLNISPYLTPWSNNSTANFNIRMETASSNLHAFTTETDSIWNPINYTISKEGTTEIVSIRMYSEYSKPLAGDLVVMFSDSSPQMPNELPYWIIVPLLIIEGLLAVIIYKKKHQQPPKS
jgi:hypothetical protein